VLKKAQKDVKKHTNMRFEWEEEARGKGRKITHLIFEFEFVADQLDLPLSEPKKKGAFDIYDLRKRLKRDAQLSQQKIEQVMRYLENNPNKREQFKDDFAPTSNRLQEGKDENNNPINSPSGYAWKRIEPLIEN
jgi:plasmid replication initiation protein